MIDFKLDEDRCIQCGKCAEDCPAGVIGWEEFENPEIVAEERCIRCGHCLAICPTAAVAILGKRPDDSIELKHAIPTAEAMVALVKGRRSIRRFKDENVEQSTLEELLQTAWHAPTGVNAQSVRFTVTRDKQVTAALGDAIYERLEGLLTDTDPAEDDLARKYMRMAHGARKEHGLDIILRGAPHILVASAPKTAPTPKEDCIIALTTFDLLAPTMRVGALWNGMLKWALVDFFPDLAARLGVPEDHVFGYVMSFGVPAMKYHRTVERGPADISVVDSL